MTLPSRTANWLRGPSKTTSRATRRHPAPPIILFLVLFSIGLLAAGGASGNSAKGATASTLSSTSTVKSSRQGSGDRKAPTTPSSLVAGAVSSTSITISWSASTGGVTGYDVFVNGAPVGSTSATTYTATGISCGTAYSLGVDAYDAAGNISGTATVSAATSACPDTQPPSVPNNLSEPARTDRTATLSWTPSTDNVGVAGYDLYVSGLKVGQTAQTTYTFSGLVCASTYTVGIDAYDAAGNSSSPQATFLSTGPCTDTTPPSAPTTLTETSSAQTSASITWTASTDNVGVAGYDVYVNGTRVAKTPQASYTLTGLSCGASYQIAADAYDAAGNTSPQAKLTAPTSACSSLPSGGSDTQAPTTPTGLQIAASTQTSVTLSWTAATDNVGITGYDLFRNGSAAGTSTQTSYAFGGLSCGTSYTLAVAAFDAAGNVSQQASVVATTNACPDAQPPSAPTNILAWNVTTTSISVSWTASTDNVGVVGYHVYRNSSLAGTTAQSTYTVAGLSCGVSYTLGVDAYDAAGNISAKTSVSVGTAWCPDTQAPSVPTGLATSAASQTSVSLNWSAATDNVGVAGYHLYLNGALVGTTGSTGYTFSNLSSGTSYSFGVDAYDAAGNTSAQAMISATTAATTLTTFTTTTPTTTTPAPSSTSSIYWGAYIEGAQTYNYLYGGTWWNAPWCDPSVQCALPKFTSNAGKAPSIEHWGMCWTCSFDSGVASQVVARGDIPAIDWANDSSATDAAIASGQFDSKLMTLAQNMKAFGHPLFLLFDEEMNGTWYPYSPGVGGNTSTDFIAMWRHVHDIFSSVGATNVTWAWVPNVDGGGAYPFSADYPGDAYVDWTGLNGYNWGLAGGTWQTFSQVFTSSYQGLLSIAPSKPIMIGEMASEENGGSKAAWITDALSTQLPKNFPQIKAMLWFNWRIYEKNQYWNWEIESSSSSQQAFANAISSSYYAPGGTFNNLPLLSKIQPLQ